MRYSKSFGLISSCIALKYTEDSHECTGCYGSTDNACYVRTHSMHEQEVGRIGFCTNLLGYTCCHRNCGYTCGTDQRIDLSTGKYTHQFTKQNTCGGTEHECDQTQSYDLQGICIQECFCAGGSTYGSTQQNNYDVHQSIGCCLSQLTNNTGLTEQVTQHQHTYQRSCGGKDQTYNDGNNDGERDEADPS